MNIHPECHCEAVAAQQSAFIQRVMQWSSDDGVDAGLSGREALVYRRNIEAMAIHALRITYPTLPTVLGEGEFRALSLSLLDHFSPATGDWGCWGRHLPYLLAQRSIAERYPFVVPLARLDWRIHGASRSATSRLQQDSLNLLQTTDPDEVLVDFSTHLSLLSSRYPLLELRANVDVGGDSEVSLSINEDINRIVVERPLLSVQSRYLEEPYYQFTLGLLQGLSVGRMLESVSAKDFDFSQWLQQAVQHNWIRCLYTSK